jgi:hypothetical protein
MSIGGERFKTVRFGDEITIVDSTKAQINRSDESDWSNLTYKDMEFMNFFRKDIHYEISLRLCY